MSKLSDLLLLFTALLLFSCGEKKADFTPASQVKDYFPVQIGKSITYRIDSTVFVKSGSQIEVHQYQVKHSIVDTTRDNQQRLTYIVQRSIRNADGSGGWSNNGRYYITPLENSVEVVEDNLRVVKIANPVLTGRSWKGNAFLPIGPYETAFGTQAGKEMNAWEFTFKSQGNESIEGQQYSDVWTIEQSNRIMNLPPPVSNPGYGSMEVSSEKYSRGIGLVYRNYQIYDFQPGYGDNGYQPTYAGFGITMWMIDHN
ncbi:hypothetical protein [Niabella drilacis]|uniref:Uncharacterized protein n=1 Tax=Niabella drilacis (strain DSM 25811 / CCM 8410 / CCUG 62505 / LMG 26954 / E90) TaxID=1285928 RepID=A0A1G6KTZ3_NIADE|nr:hypothetical protein [Niabella drilacis]SDC34550.1 hypothetical protein SAMN04487894_102104 [Niabella drilacis]